MRDFERKNQPPIIGTREFISRVKDRFFKNKIDKKIPASKALAPDLDQIISEVRRYHEIKGTSLTAVHRGIENEPRDVAVYLIRTMRAEPLMKIGAGFGLKRYSSVSSVVARSFTPLSEPNLHGSICLTFTTL